MGNGLGGVGQWGRLPPPLTRSASPPWSGLPRTATLCVLNVVGAVVEGEEGEGLGGEEELSPHAGEGHPALKGEGG